MSVYTTRAFWVATSERMVKTGAQLFDLIRAIEAHIFPRRSRRKALR